MGETTISHLVAGWVVAAWVVDAVAAWVVEGSEPGGGAPEACVAGCVAGCVVAGVASAGAVAAWGVVRRRTTSFFDAGRLVGCVVAVVRLVSLLS